MSDQCSNPKCCSSENATNISDASSEECCKIPEKLLALADQAWEEVVKEKIKQQIIASDGEKLDKLVQIVAQANAERWAHRIQGKARCDEYKSKLKEFFTSSCS